MYYGKTKETCVKIFYFECEYYREDILFKSMVTEKNIFKGLAQYDKNDQTD